ncbi:FAD-binding oxidoreductase [Ignatzschineria rhizosphaerae]|uniref:FAD-binding oxidoreductase n=1 Tax=Ignatzschineria rhizosphaerae TaxID=2923279 RepID=A0ABY3X6U8_9GAMM|nr:FAD-binding oxidoreductase [Ignatzschineria rhizosphaerae]UNM97489.1 FAD-binding oxidoreductase [Ignatzschineria rhizosphaerae]
MKQEAIVIGAGMVGISIAWHLQQKNFQVTVLDRKAPGEETSYGNAGLIQREAIYPHPFPREIKEMLRVLPNTSLDIRFRPKALMHYAKPLWQYFQFSAKQPYDKIVEEWATLIEHATKEHEVMFTASDAEYLVRQKGWLQLHRDQKSLDAIIAKSTKLTAHGVEFKILTPKEIALLEPDLDVSHFVGGIHWLNAWQVTSPGDLTKAYAENFKKLGGIIKETTVTNLHELSDGSWDITTTKEQLKTQNLIIATGPWSHEILKLLGYNFPLFPMRGYHTHYQAAEGKMLNHSIVDEDNGYVLSPQKLGIRLTTGAEFTFIDAPIKDEQLQADIKVARELFPLESPVEKTPWFGHRPCLPDMKPIIDKAPKHQNLWLAFGHAHQGFTLGPATGRLMSEMISGETPYIDPAPFKATRF